MRFFPGKHRESLLRQAHCRHGGGSGWSRSHEGGMHSDKGGVYEERSTRSKCRSLECGVPTQGVINPLSLTSSPISSLSSHAVYKSSIMKEINYMNLIHFFLSKRHLYTRGLFVWSFFALILSDFLTLIESSSSSSNSSSSSSPPTLSTPRNFVRPPDPMSARCISSSRCA